MHGKIIVENEARLQPNANDDEALIRWRCTENITKSHFNRGVNVNREAMSKTIHIIKFCLL